MATAPTELFAKAQAAIDWYWKFGVQRTGPKYEVARGTWLDEIYRIRARAQAAARAAESSKPVMALWGPSQTGKSTLLSHYLDLSGDDWGCGSALHWSESEPVRFVAGNVRSDELISLNPYNFHSDASGCVSRFVLRDGVMDPEHPVEIVFATDFQLLQSLATGYLSECEAQNARGETTLWGEDSYKALVERQRVTGQPQRAAFEAVQQLADTVELLILADLPRYADLKKSWQKSLRTLTVQSPALLASMDAIETFAYELFWDNWPSLTRTYKMLVARRRQMAAEWGGAPVRGSFRTAAILLDIDSYKKYSANADSVIRRKVDGITVSRGSDEAICLGQGTGTPLVRGADDFGALQALVWELKIPLRRDVLHASAPVLAEFFERADLLDFPGVGNNPGNAKLHTDEAVLASPQIALTEVFKRGKTASIVVTSARNLDIDGFSILVRLDRPPGQPKQLVAGIRSWMESYDPAFWPPKRRELPLNLVTTFSAWLLNQVRRAGLRDGLQPVFERFTSISHLADAKVVTTFATNYPQFDDGHFHGTPEESQRALADITGDAAFRERFGDSEKSFREMEANGGTDYLFERLTEQAAGSRRAEIVAARLDAAAQHLQELLLQHAPGENAEAAERERALDAWAGAIAARIGAPPASRDEIGGVTTLSMHLRAFVNVDPEKLEDVPQNAFQRRYDVRGFIENQFSRWRDTQANYPYLDRLGLTDATHARRVLSYLVEALDLDAVENFFHKELDHLGSRSEGKDARRFLAVSMNNALLDRGGLLPVKHRSMHKNGTEPVPDLLLRLARVESSRHPESEQSPHYLAVVAPFLRRIEAIKSQQVGDRAPQIGDAELLGLVHLA